MLEMDQKELIRILSRELDKRQLLVAAQGIERVGSQRISRYKFRHVLFQKYLYHNRVLLIFLYLQTPLSV